MKILAINPGSTSTKISLYENESFLWDYVIQYDTEVLKDFKSIYEQYDLRLRDINEVLEKHEVKISDLSAIVGRGGPAIPFKSGAYRMNEKLLNVLKTSTNLHISLLGGILAYKIAKPSNIPSFIYDPVSVDELSDVARLSGLKELPRISVAHFLNIRACCHKVAQKENCRMEDMNFLAAHLGGGISMLAMNKGKATDVVADDEGPFTPERTGGLQLWAYTKYAFGHDEKTMLNFVRGKGGTVSYLGTTDMIEIERRIKNGDDEARLVHDALAYQTAKSLSSLAPVLYGKIDRIILTGGLTKSEMLIEKITERISFLGKVEVIAGEHEMEALTQGALRVLKGEESAHEL